VTENPTQHQLSDNHHQIIYSPKNSISGLAVLLDFSTHPPASCGVKRHYFIYLLLNQYIKYMARPLLIGGQE
jgi:hypothetical protein